MALPEAYEGYLNDLSSKLMEQVGTVDYTPRSTGTLKSALQKIIRPTYEKNIQTRQQATRSNRAAVDADAAARGIGASTWVSDMKNRLNTNEARDIANINDDYSSQLYSALMGRLAEQDQLSLAAQQANMNARQGALGNALSGAQYLYGLDQAKAGSGGGGGGGRGGRGSNDEDGPVDDAFGAGLANKGIKVTADVYKNTNKNEKEGYDTRPLTASAQATPSASYSQKLSQAFMESQRTGNKMNTVSKANTKSSAKSNIDKYR